MGVQLSEDKWTVITVAYNPGSIAAATTAEQTLTVPGLRTTDMVILSKPTLTAGVGIVNERVSAADTLAVTWVNATAGSIDPPQENYTLWVFRAENIKSVVAF